MKRINDYDGNEKISWNDMKDIWQPEKINEDLMTLQEDVMKKMAILTITPEAIREIMDLPEGAIILCMAVPIETNGVMKIKIEGAGWDTPEGGMVRHSNAARASRDEHGKLTVDWRLGD